MKTLAQVTCAFVAVFLVSANWSNDVTREQKREVNKIKSIVDRAEKSYRGKKIEACVKSITDAQQRLTKLAGGAGDELIQLIQPQYDRIQKAHELLTEKGEKLSALATLEEMRKSGGDGMPDSGNISFTSSIAPILVNKCGRCHVDRTSGGLSMASYDSLARGTPVGSVIVPAQPQNSRIIEVIESGDMPRGGLTVEKIELDQLKKWISQGARFDGSDRSAQLRSLVSTTPDRPPAPPIEKPTGKETVSFSLEIAPILVTACTGCHVNPQQNVRGGLNMSTIARMFRGGDSGPAVMPGDLEKSPFYQRVIADDRGRMPFRRPALPAEQIAKIKTWIEEGAKFDGREPRQNLTEVVAIARAENATHDQLSAERKTLAMANWQKTTSSTGANVVESNEFLILGDAPQPQLQTLSTELQAIAADLRSQLTVPDNLPLAKGRITVYWFSRRYDFSEFGKMVLGRDIPQGSVTVRRADTVDGFIAFLASPDDLESIKPRLARSIAATSISSANHSTPDWFAGGLSHLLVASRFDRHPLITQWKQQSAMAFGQMNSGDDFIKGRLSDELSELVGMEFITRLSTHENFKAFMNDLRSQADFRESFERSFGNTPENLATGRNRPSRPNQNKKGGRKNG